MRHCCATHIFDPGDQVEILDSGIIGTIAEVYPATSDRIEHKYAVEYVDRDGNPQERVWRQSQLEPWSPDDDEIPVPEKVVMLDTYRSARRAA